MKSEVKGTATSKTLGNTAVGDQPQTYALDRAADGTGIIYKWDFKF